VTDVCDEIAQWPLKMLPYPSDVKSNMREKSRQNLKQTALGLMIIQIAKFSPIFTSNFGPPSAVRLFKNLIMLSELLKAVAKNGRRIFTDG
jgi:hypothetical protein